MTFLQLINKLKMNGCRIEQISLYRLVAFNSRNVRAEYRLDEDGYWEFAS